MKGPKLCSFTEAQPNALSLIAVRRRWRPCVIRRIYPLLDNEGASNQHTVIVLRAIHTSSYGRSVRIIWKRRGR